MDQRHSLVPKHPQYTDKTAPIPLITTALEQQLHSPLQPAEMSDDEGTKKGYVLVLLTQPPHPSS